MTTETDDKRKSVGNSRDDGSCANMFTPYRTLYTDVVDRFTVLCNDWEEENVIP